MIDAADGLQGYQPNSNSSSININTQSACHLSVAAPDPAVSQNPSLTFRQDQVFQTSTDDYPPIAVQSASGIALPSRGVASSASALLGPTAEPQSYSTIGNLSAPVLGIHTTGGSSWVSSQGTGVLTPHLPTGSSQPLSVATGVDTHSSVGLAHLLGAINQLASSTGHASVLLREPTTAMSAPQPSETPENALDVLLSALPSDVASSFEAGFSIVTHQLLATSESETTRPTSRPSPSGQTDRSDVSTSRPHTRTEGRPTSRPTSHHTQRPISNSSSIHHPPRPTSHHTSRPSTNSTSQPTSSRTTLSTRPSPTSQPTSSTTTTDPTATAELTNNAANSTPPSISPEKQQSNGTIAGIATGTIAGVVLITLAIFFFLRRRQRKNAAAASSKQQAYPEVAWLYDPVRSPPRSLSPSPQIGSSSPQLGMTQTPARRSSLLAPEVVVVAEGEPLLAPGRAATRESSPAPALGGGRNASPAGR
ncbi:hypothetical protein Q7P37_005466 [Cladosporium fusiforme]